ncbi:MAG TPA: hypothetical protein VNR60_06375 [Croceibacterium sp.]|nr:hypothetical protein [Croceibacterium sp.]
MEYEIDSEAALFDRSTNPSLEDHHPRPKPRKHKDRKAVSIPEEEPQAR